MKKVLDKKFFNRDTKTVAKELLGKFLVRKIGNTEVSVMIVETEAYDGPDDKASHTSKGKTQRTEVMFGKPGIFYVYLCYGMHFMLNVVTREAGYPAAVLIRGAAVKNSKEILQWTSRYENALRSRKKWQDAKFCRTGKTTVVAVATTRIFLSEKPVDCQFFLSYGAQNHSVMSIDGPGKVTKFLKIDKNLNCQTSVKATGLWFEDRGVIVKENSIKKMPRVGVNYAGPKWSSKKLRFILK